MRFRVGEAAIVTFLFSFVLLLSVLTAEPVELPRCRVALGAELGQQSLDLAIPFGRDAADRVLALGDAEMHARCGGVGERLVAVAAAPPRGRVGQSAPPRDLHPARDEPARTTHGEGKS